jgi:O-antigen/teichoic acid export membrane protein
VTTPHADTVARSETVAAPEIAVDAAAGTALWHTIMRGGLIGSAFRLVTLLVSFVVTPIAITHAGTTSYGLFASLTAFAGLLTFADLGIGNGAIREIIASRRDPSSGSESDVIATALTVLSIAGAAVAALGVVAALLVPWQSLLNAPAGSGTTLRWAVAFGSLAIGCAVPGALAQRVLLARQQPGRASAWISLGSIAGSIAVLVAVLAGHHVPAMVAAQLGGPAVIALVSLWVVATRGGWARSTARASKTVALRLLAGGRLFAFLQIVAVVNFEVDNLVVARLRGPTDVTTFAATGRLFAIPITLGTMFFLPLWAGFADAWQRHDIGWLRSAFRRSTRIGFGAAIPVACLAAIFGRWAIRTWTHHAVTPSLSLVIASCIWLVIYALNQPQAMLLNGMHDARFQIRSATLNLAANLPLSVLFTIKFGISGPIWGTICAQLICALIPATYRIRRLLHATA